jgi:hypothetical protein
MLVTTEVAYLEPAFLLAAQRALISSESRFRPAGVSAPFFRVEPFCFPPAFLLAAQRAFIASDNFFRPAAVSPLRRLRDLAGLVLPSALRTPAQRARAAAASFARVAADMGRRLPRLPRRLAPDDGAPPPNNELRRASSVCICSRIETASFSF